MASANRAASRRADRSKKAASKSPNDAAPEAPAQDGVFVAVTREGDGLSVAAVRVGDVRVGEVVTVLELGAKTVRKQLILDD